jgi:single-stranded-DNA-specific exonuclease
METDAGAGVAPGMRWRLRRLPQGGDESAVGRLGAELNSLPAALSRSLLLRNVSGFDGARSFFRDGLETLHDPFAMNGMQRAAERLAEAVTTGERVLVYGDYDVDGTTSTALMMRFLRDNGGDPHFFIPNRFRHGYGLCTAGLDRAAAIGAKLVVALDCGVTAVQEADYARSIGLDLVVCDHHEPGPILPDAFAVLDPKRRDCTYPFDGLSGCGVGFKLVQGTLSVLGRPADEAYRYLDLVAVSVACDIVPILGENRVLMRAGLARLADSPQPGFAALAGHTNVDLQGCTSSRIVFQIGPRINAAGRLEDASIAAELLLADDEQDALRLAERLESLNLKRRELDQATRDEAIGMAEIDMEAGPLSLVLYKAGWHPGIVGITASRVAEHFGRPTVLLTSNGHEEARGSARSVRGVDLHAALSKCSDLLTRFGGHAHAAGLALPVENIPALRERLEDSVGTTVTAEDLEPEIELDAHLSLRDVDDRFWRVLKQFDPFGPDNPKPVFWGSDLRVIGQPTVCGAERRHLRFRVAQRDGGGASYSVIGFNLADKLPTAMSSLRVGRPMELAFVVEENEWNGRTTLQLRAEDLRLQG